jgi:hypothetical protein
MATIKQIVDKAYTKVNGEYESITDGSDDFRTYLNVLNQVMEMWWHTPYVNWQSLFDPHFTLPDSIAAGVFEYTVPDSPEIKIANSPFDHVFIMDDAILVKTYKLTDQALYQSAKSGDICAYFGNKLYFKNISDDMVGLQICLPVYVMPTVYTAGTQVVNIDSVPWLVARIAAFICDSSPVPFIARNADKFYKEAEVYMKEMKDNNRHRQHLAIKSPGRVFGDARFNSLSAAIDAGVGVAGLNSVDGGTF